MTPKEWLKFGLARIKDPKNWCKGFYRLGECYCARGAILIAPGGDFDRLVPEKFRALELLDRAAADLFSEFAEEARRKGWCLTKAPSAVYVNDNLGHDAVLRVYRRALELA